MVISETEPTDKVEGMQWLNPTTGLVLFWDDEKWLQMPTTGAAGKDGVDGVDGLWTDNGDTSISYTAGNVGIGTETPTAYGGGYGILTVNGSTAGLISLQNNNVAVAEQYYDTAANEFRLQTNTDDGSIAFRPGPVGQATAMTIGADGKVAFSEVSIKGGSIWRNLSGTGGIALSSDNGPEITPLGNDGIQTDAQMNLGRPAYRFKNGYFSGSVTLRSGVALGSRDLIETLSTLRNATKDETTLEGLRDSIGNAIGGLIEKFEAEIATMPAPEVSTQEIADE
jgi:hypothetical protein